VFKSKGDDEYTDADIDTLIRRGEEPHISPVSPVHLASPLYLPKALSKDEMLSMIRFGAGMVQP